MTNDQQHEPCFYERWSAELLNATLPFVGKALALTTRRDGVHDGATSIMRVELGDLRKLLKATEPRAVPRDVHASEVELERLRTLLRQAAVATGEQLGEWDELPTVIERLRRAAQGGR